MYARGGKPRDTGQGSQRPATGRFALLSRNPPQTATQRNVACFILDVPGSKPLAALNALNPQASKHNPKYARPGTSRSRLCELDCTQTKEKSFCEWCNQSGPKAVRNSQPHGVITVLASLNPRVPRGVVCNRY